MVLLPNFTPIVKELSTKLVVMLIQVLVAKTLRRVVLTILPFEVN